MQPSGGQRAKIERNDALSVLLSWCVDELSKGPIKGGLTAQAKNQCRAEVKDSWERVTHSL